MHSFKKISHFICNFISLICSFQQCQCCECGNVSMGFWKSRVKQKSFVSLVISKTPYSHFLLTAFTQCYVNVASLALLALTDKLARVDETTIIPPFLIRIHYACHLLDYLEQSSIVVAQFCFVPFIVLFM